MALGNLHKNVAVVTLLFLPLLICMGESGSTRLEIYKVVPTPKLRWSATTLNLVWTPDPSGLVTLFNNSPALCRDVPDTVEVGIETCCLVAIASPS